MEQHQDRPPDAWLTVNEACKYLKVTRRTLYTYMDRGQLPYHQMPSGRGRRFRVEDLDQLLERRRGAGPESREPKTFIEWIKDIYEITDRMSDEDKAALTKWEEENLHDESLSSADWPGWRRLGLHPHPRQGEILEMLKILSEMD